MADILASVSVQLGMEVSAFKAALADARKELKGFVQFGEALQGLGESLTKYVSAPLVGLGALAVTASAQMESLRKGLQAISVQDVGQQGVSGLLAVQQAAQATGERIQVLQDIAKAPGIGFEEAVKGDIRLRAVGISAAQSAAILREFANAIALTGGGAAELNQVTVQLGQMAAKGKVLSQDLRPILEQAPAVAAALKKMFGTVDSEDISQQLEKAGQSSSDFIARLTDELGKAPRVTGGLANAFENLAQSSKQSLAKLGDGISEALNLPAVVAKLSDGIERIGATFASLSPGVQKAVIVFGGLAAAAGPVLVAVGSIGAALPYVVAGFETLGLATTTAAVAASEGAAAIGASTTLALGPLALVAAGVALAAYEIYSHWEEIRAYFTSGEGGRLFAGLAASVKGSIGEIRAAVDSLQGLGGNSFGDLLSAGNLLKGAVREIAVGFTALADVVGGVIGGINKALHGDFASALTSAKQALFGLVDPLAGVFGFTKKVDTSGLATLGQAARQAGQALDEATLSSLFLGGSLQGLAKQTGLLADLEARLKALKEAKPTLTSEADVAASNQQIASLEAQIKKLNELGIGSKEMAKAYADVQKSFREIAGESAALGEQFNYLQARQAADQSGIKKLLDAGYSPFSAAVQKLVGDLKNLNVTLGDNAPLSLRGLQGLKLPETPEFKLKLPETIKPPAVLPMDLSGLSVDAEGLLQGFDKLAAAARAGGEKLTAAQENSLNRQREFNTNMEELTSQLGSSIGPLLADFAGQLGDAFGSIVAGTASAGDALGAAFSGILASLGNFMGDFGKQLIAIGIGKVALDTLFEGPQGGVLAIAAGVGLVALAGVAKAISTSASSSLKSIGAGGTGGLSTSVASTPRTYTPATSAPATAPAVTVNHRVSFAMHGDEMLAFIDIQQDKRGRVVGTRR